MGDTVDLDRREAETPPETSPQPGPAPSKPPLFAGFRLAVWPWLLARRRELTDWVARARGRCGALAGTLRQCWADRPRIRQCLGTDEAWRWWLLGMVGASALLLSGIAACLTVIGLDSAERAVSQGQQDIAGLQLQVAELARADRRQVAILASERRAWLKVSLNQNAGMEVFRYPYTVKVAARTPLAVPQLQFQVANVGHAPAFNVRFFAWGFVPTPGHTDPLAAQRRRCARVAQANPGKSAGGLTMFPGDDVLSTALTGTDRTVADVSLGAIAGALKLYPNDSIPLYVIGCVDYSLRPDGAAKRQTRFALSLEHVVRQANGVAAIQKGFSFRDNVPPADFAVSTRFGFRSEAN